MRRRKLYRREALNEINDSEKLWETSTLAHMRAKMPEQSERFQNSSEMILKPVYTPADVKNLDYIYNLGFPGEYPYTRGIYPSMYRSKLWIMRQLSGYGNPEAARERLRFLAEQGNDAPNLIPDLVTGLGHESDSDHPFVRAQLGLVGTPIDTVADLDEMLRDIALDRIHVSFAWSCTSFIDVAMMQVLAERRGIPLNKLRGTVQNDILFGYYLSHCYIFPPKHGLRIVRDTIAYCAEKLPLVNSVGMPGGTNTRALGCNAAFELALTIAAGTTYVQSVIDTGMNVDKFGPGITFVWYTLLGDFFEEICKFRALRRMWAKVMKDRFGAKDPRSMQARIAGNGMGATKTRQQPLNNIIRGTMEALIGVLGGVQSLHVTPYDEALGMCPTEAAATIALRTQQIVAYESGICNVVDPLGGSYYVEYLTNELEKGATKYLNQIEDWGGMLNAIEKGFIQSEIHRQSYDDILRQERGEKIKVGVNKFVTEREPDMDVFKVNPEWIETHLRKLATIKKERNNEKVVQTLVKVKSVSATDENIMPAVIEAVRAHCTTGEICDALREVYGEWKDPYP